MIRMACWIKYPVVQGSCSIEAIKGRRLHIFSFPFMPAMSERCTGEELNASVKVATCKMLSNGRHIYTLPCADDRLRIKDHNTYSRTDCDIT